MKILRNVIFIFMLVLLVSCTKRENKMIVNDVQRNTITESSKNIDKTSKEEKIEFDTSGSGKKSCFPYGANIVNNTSYPSDINFGDISLFPTDARYLNENFRYKKIISWRRWDEPAIKRKLKSYAETPEGENFIGHKYSSADIGLMQLESAILFDEDQKKIIEVEDSPYYDGKIVKLNEYNDLGLQTNIYDFRLDNEIILFSEEFYNELKNIDDKLMYSYEYIDIKDNPNILKYNHYFYHSKGKKLLESGRISKTLNMKNTMDNNFFIARANKSLKYYLKETHSYALFYYDEMGRLSKIEPIPTSMGWKFYDVEYDGNKLLEGKLKFSEKSDTYFKYVYTKHDKNDNWIEAKIFYDDDTEASYTAIREIEYYEN
ncbi:hypothetical protein [Treponema denticola]|uniref:hypothetical protein n=1 Tax=Treponema denticola TaxID=158 RepID=UPI0020A2C884|nr:hypothetical protein [Treponema denticola]UTC87307.1 hypothetical protein E4N79_03745 [Treponema denticola]